jgi:hypothetical protein
VQVSGSGAASCALGSVVSAIRGRLRLRIAKPYRTLATYEQTRRTLDGTPGVSSVDVNASTGSLLITYDPETLPFGDLLTLGSALDVARAPSGIGLAAQCSSRFGLIAGGEKCWTTC